MSRRRGSRFLARSHPPPALPRCRVRGSRASFGALQGLVTSSQPLFHIEVSLSLCGNEGSFPPMGRPFCWVLAFWGSRLRRYLQPGEEGETHGELCAPGSRRGLQSRQHPMPHRPALTAGDAAWKFCVSLRLIHPLESGKVPIRRTRCPASGMGVQKTPGDL